MAMLNTCVKKKTSALKLRMKIPAFSLHWHCQPISVMWSFDLHLIHQRTLK